MSTATSSTSPLRRFFGVVARPQSYRNICYLLLGLPLGTIWFTVLVSGVSIGVSLLVVALLGIPVLLGLWYVTRAFANVERATAGMLLGHHLEPVPLTSGEHGNVWSRLRATTCDRDRWRELAYLALRFPVGIATFTAAVTLLTAPVVVASAPFAARYDDDQPFGDWALSSTIEDVASWPTWSWLLVPFGLLVLIASFHVVNTLTGVCGRWATAWLGGGASCATRRSGSTQP